LTSPCDAPFKKVNFLSRDIKVLRRADGSLVLKSRHPLKSHERLIPAYLRRWSEEAPERVWLAQRRGPDRAWQKVTYAQARRTVDALTQSLLNIGLNELRPVMILSGNSIEHALMIMAAMQAGVPAAPISVAYSLVSQDHTKLRQVFELVKPGLVFVQSGVQFQRALAALNLKDAVVAYVDDAPSGLNAISYSELAATSVGEAVERAYTAVGPKTVAKYLFTSGSTGFPKAVINTQEMMCGNVAMLQQAMPTGFDDPPPVGLHWLPWSHTFGGNASFNGTLADGGTFYIDDGRPLPGQFEETLRNLREISPTAYANVPAGFAALANALEGDEVLCRTFFKDLRMLGYGGAALPSDLYRRMEALAVTYTGHRISFITGWGSTETAPVATSTHWQTDRAGLIGLPLPGVELKLVPLGSKYECRVRGIAVTPGYHKRPDLTAQAFDEEGFYKIGDAATFVDRDDPAQGLVFAGRVVEDFKLSSGTFVHVGTLRVAAIAAASPVIQDAVVTGQDRDYVGLLAWPSLLACRQLTGLSDATAEELIRERAIIERIEQGLARHNARYSGSTFQIRRVLLMAIPPSIDANELTDKGYINQRATLERRVALVDRLYAEPAMPEVIVIGNGQAVT
jgi:feruloyl-CoA synthase